jgi:hypothetical protein
MLLIPISIVVLINYSREALAFSITKPQQAAITTVRSPFIHSEHERNMMPFLSIHRPRSRRFAGNAFRSSYREFSDFDNNDDEEEEDDDDDDDYINLDDSAVAKFRAMMGIPKDSNLQEEEEEEEEDNDYPEIIEDSDLDNLSSIEQLITFATTKSDVGTDAPATEWAKPVDISDISKSLTSGVCLVANPAKFCEDLATNSPPSLALLSKFGLTLPPPPELGPDRRADLLPVLILLDRHPLRGCHALLLNRRTGYLIGDLENQQFDSNDGTKSTNTSSTPPNLGAFMIQPLWFGGTSSSRGDQNSSINGLDMIHLCPLVKGARQITEDGVFHGGDPVQAQEAMSDPSLERIMTGFDFKFFVQSTRWLPMQVSNSNTFIFQCD